MQNYIFFKLFIYTAEHIIYKLHLSFEPVVLTADEN